MALTARSIITLSNVKEYLDIRPGEPGYDTFLETQIDWVSGWIESYIGGDANTSDFQPQKVALQDVELILDGNGGNRLSLPHAIVRIAGTTDAEKLANLQYREDADEAWADLITDMDYVPILPNQAMEIELLGDETFPKGRGNIRIEYVTGMDPVPTELQMVCLERVADNYKKSNKGNASLGVQSQGVSGAMGVTVTSKDLLPEWERILKRYRKRRLTIQGITL